MGIESESVSMPLFKDLGKPTKDLLSKNYDFGEHKVEISSGAGDASFDTNWSSKGKSKLETHYKLPNNTNLDIECASNSDITATLKMKGLAPGLTVKTKASTTSNMFLGLEYMQDKASLTADVDVGSSGPVFNGSALFQQSSFTCGGSLKVVDAGLSDYALGLGYGEAKNFEVTAKFTETFAPKPKPLSLLVQYIHFVNGSISCGAQFSRALDEAGTSTTALGGTYKMPGGTKVGVKIDSSSKLGLHSIHPLNDGVTLTQSLQLDVANLSSNHKYGFNLKFKH